MLALTILVGMVVVLDAISVIMALWSYKKIGLIGHKDPKQDMTCRCHDHYGAQPLAAALAMGPSLGEITPEAAVAIQSSILNRMRARMRPAPVGIEAKQEIVEKIIAAILDGTPEDKMAEVITIAESLGPELMALDYNSLQHILQHINDK